MPRTARARTATRESDDGDREPDEHEDGHEGGREREADDEDAGG
jgi:hypothetical protein